MKKAVEYLFAGIILAVGGVVGLAVLVLAALLAALPYIIVITTAIILAAFFLELGPFSTEN